MSLRLYFLESNQVKHDFIIQNEGNLDVVIEIIKSAFQNGNKVLIAGNGGSAADSQHFAAELIARYKMERRALPVIALTVDTSAITAIGNDYDFESIFSRQIEGLGYEGDIFIGFSTSGNSQNIVKAMEVAKMQGLICIGILGGDGGKIKDYCDYTLIVSSYNTPRIQETHLLIYHTICEEIEKRLFL